MQQTVLNTIPNRQILTLDGITRTVLEPALTVKLVIIASFEQILIL